MKINLFYIYNENINYKFQKNFFEKYYLRFNIFNLNPIFINKKSSKNFDIKIKAWKIMFKQAQNLDNYFLYLDLDTFLSKNFIKKFINSNYKNQTNLFMLSFDNKKATANAGFFYFIKKDLNFLQDLFNKINKNYNFNHLIKDEQFLTILYYKYFYNDISKNTNYELINNLNFLKKFDNFFKMDKKEWNLFTRVYSISNIKLYFKDLKC